MLPHSNERQDRCCLRVFGRNIVLCRSRGALLRGFFLYESLHARSKLLKCLLLQFFPEAGAYVLACSKNLLNAIHDEANASMLGSLAGQCVHRPRPFLRSLLIAFDRDGAEKRVEVATPKRRNAHGRMAFGVLQPSVFHKSQPVCGKFEESASCAVTRIGILLRRSGLLPRPLPNFGFALLVCRPAFVALFALLFPGTLHLGIDALTEELGLVK
mmetsp:Transcript_17654/g.50278  ORF Transcript_17654/g.50278 Transcript_17654/m.50278 type:complete len:214 (-) Transcript_17654:1396-2037(-)